MSPTGRLSHVRDFSAVVEDPPVSAEGAIWLVVSEAGQFFLERWTADMKRNVRAAFPAGTMNAQFRGLAQDKDGWLYSVKESGVGTGSWTLVKRFKATSSKTLTFQDYFTMAVGNEMADGAPNHFVVRPLISGADGKVYAHIRPTGVNSFDNPTGFSLRTVSDGALGTAWEFPTVKTNFQNMTFGMSGFSLVTFAAIIKRCMFPAVLKSGRWVAADAVPFYGFGSSPSPGMREWVAQAGSGPHPFDTFVGLSVQVWGDGYWDSASPGTPWTAVAAGLNTSATSFTREGMDGSVKESPDPPSVHHSMRVTVAGGNANLPTYEGHQMFGWGSVNVRQLSTSDQQVFQVLTADNQFLYLVLGGFACVGGFCPDSGTAQDRGGVWRAAIPSVGSLPTSWTRIIPAIGGDFLIPAAGFLWNVPDRYTTAGALTGTLPVSGGVTLACGAYSALWK